MLHQRNLAAMALLASLVVICPVVLAADTLQTIVQAAPVNARNLHVGDRAPDVYTRSEKALVDWKKRGLNTPQSQSQWVQVNDKYMLVHTGNGQVLAVMPIER
ncbi:RcnB family protein [Pseudomonas sp. H3(2019)]|uniref:RcnB family protein n=1 Tax=Pseudomonas sp. H3(2019) TaxID=2598724 RepID=UPI0011979E6E|nr:RcnB family protein [Pseudomonas sp. H3(2019)]TVT79737.1 RcnB family protein [Pseudomonas sp. H3(2019)]